MIVEFRAPARQELLEAGQWYLQNGGPAVAEQFGWAVERALQLLALMPKLGTPTYAQVRLWPLKRYPYTLVYSVHDDLLSVLAVAHQSRAPEYWRGQ